MGKEVWMFPGQGSQEVGMGLGLYEASTEVQTFFKNAEDITGKPLRKVMFEGPSEELNRMSNAQVALFLVSQAAIKLYAAKHPGETPDYVAGHSVGEIAAATVGGAISEEDGIYLINERGEAMEDAALQNPGGMAAILKLEDERVEELAARHGVYVANYNIPNQQSVISGELEAIDVAIAAAEAQGGRAIKLAVQGAAHSKLMQPAVQRVAKAADKITVVDPAVGLIANQTGKLMTKAEELRNSFPYQLTHPVRWGAGVEQMQVLGVREYIEFGSKDVLCGMIRRQTKGQDVTIWHAETELLIQN